jgi:hypothetical protein
MWFIWILRWFLERIKRWWYEWVILRREIVLEAYFEAVSFGLWKCQPDVDFLPGFGEGATFDLQKMTHQAKRGSKDCLSTPVFN